MRATDRHRGERNGERGEGGRREGGRATNREAGLADSNRKERRTQL